jgi:predicted transcriptional regulator
MRIEPELREALGMLADRSDRSFSAEVRRALWAHVESRALALNEDSARPTQPDAVEDRPVAEAAGGS